MDRLPFTIRRPYPLPPHFAKFNRDAALAEALRDLTQAAKAILEELPSNSTFMEARLLLDVQAFVLRLRSDAEAIRGNG